MPLRAPGSERIRMVRVNVGDVPIRIMSEGYMKDEFRVQYVNGPEGWHVTFPDNEQVCCVPGPGRLSRLGFVDWEVLPQAASFLMRPV